MPDPRVKDNSRSPARVIALQESRRNKSGALKATKFGPITEKEKADAEINEQIQKQLKDEKTKRAEAKRKAKEDKAKSHNAST